MTKDQVNYILNKYGGKEKVVGEMMFEIFFDNPRNYIPNTQFTKEERLEALDFDDANELVVILDKNYLFMSMNDYTPSQTRLFIPYDNIQGIHVMEEVILDNYKVNTPTKE